MARIQGDKLVFVIQVSSLVTKAFQGT